MHEKTDMRQKQEYNQFDDATIQQWPSSIWSGAPTSQQSITSGLYSAIPCTHINIVIENSSNKLVQGVYLMYNNIHGSSKDESKRSMKILTNARPSDTIPQC